VLEGNFDRNVQFYCPDLKLTSGRLKTLGKLAEQLDTKEETYHIEY